MASVVDICNLALAHLGETPNISSIDPPEGGPYAEHCAAFYPIARNMILELNDWTFALKRQALSALGTVSLPGWEYAYSIPSDCIKVLRVLSEDQDDAPDDLTPIDFIVETTTAGVTLFTNQESAVLQYTAKVDDPTKWSPLFINALSWLLASYLAGPITKDPRVKDTCYQNFWAEMAKGVNSNTNVDRQAQYPRHVPAWIRNR